MDTIQDFLGTRRKGYRWILNEYFRELKQDPNTYFKNQRRRDYKKDITTWWDNHIHEVPKTRNTKLSVMHTFFDHYEIMYPKAFWLGLRRQKKGSRAATLDRVPTTQEFKSMLEHGDIKDKALFLFLMTSGMRVNECLKVTIPMVRMNNDPVLIKLPGSITKTGDPRITFITDEAKHYLEAWLRIRQKYIDTAIKKTQHLCKKQYEDNRVWPFTYDVVWTCFNRLTAKIGIDERDQETKQKRHIVHPYSLRKFFLSQMKLDVPAVIPEALAGHEKYLDESYRRFSPEELGAYYKKAEARLTILGSTPDLSGLHSDIEALKKENTELKEDMAKLMRKIMVQG